MPHSSAVWPRSVLRRQCSTMLRPSKAPMVTLLLPTSSANSTHTSRYDQPFRAVLLLDDEESGRIACGGGPIDGAVDGFHHHPPAAGITGGAIEQVEDTLLATVDQQAAVAFHSRQDRKSTRLNSSH